MHQRRHDHRDAREDISHHLIRQRDVVPEINKDQRDRRQRDERVNQASAHKNAEPISEITHRFRQQRIDLAFANVRGDLPFVFGGRDKIADQKRQQIIINHRTVIVAVQLAPTFFEDGAPEKNGACQWNQPEEGAQEIIPAINKGILQPNVKNRDVLIDPSRAHGRNRSLKTSSLISCSGGL